MDKKDEIRKCPKCKTPDLSAKSLGGWSGGRDFVSSFVKCSECGHHYWNKHYVEPRHDGGIFVIFPRCARG